MFENYYAGKRILVTGHTGFKGSWLSQWLINMGAKVGGFSVDIPTQPSLFEDLKLSEKLIHVQGDINDPEALTKFFNEFQPEGVFHLAAQPLVRASYNDPVATFTTNVIGTLNVLEAIRKTPSVRFGIMVTSDKCYENNEWEYGYREIDRIGGKDPYSASKGCTEIAISSYFRSFLHHPQSPLIASVRAGNVIGGGDWAQDRIVPDAVRAWSANRELEIRNPKAVRPWQHVLEPLSGYLWLGSQLVKFPQQHHGEAFNFGPTSDANRTVIELLNELKQTWPGQTGIRVQQSQLDTKPEAGLLQLNCDKAWARLEWKSCLSFKETVEMTTSWYQGQNKDVVQNLTQHQIQTYVEIAASKKMKWTL